MALATDGNLRVAAWQWEKWNDVATDVFREMDGSDDATEQGFINLPDWEGLVQSANNREMRWKVMPAPLELF